MTTQTPTAPRLREADERLLKLAPSAAEKILELREREASGDYLRLRITGGGCNGLTYKLKFVAEPREGDLLVRSQGVPVLIDSKSALYLKGMVMEYSDRLLAGGFRFNNPNARASCSCGESFSV